jgi:hypothetical protein
MKKLVSASFKISTAPTHHYFLKPHNFIDLETLNPLKAVG